jgi:hypothetical protein
MIEYFRHEAMNQATVVSGFAEIISSLILKNPESASPEFNSALIKVRQIITTFNETLSVFREECSLNGIDENQLMALDPYGDILHYLSEGCRIHYKTLRDIAESLYGVTGSIEPSRITDAKIAERFTLVHESAAKLVDLFLHPLFFIQDAVRKHRT